VASDDFMPSQVKDSAKLSTQTRHLPQGGTEALMTAVGGVAPELAGLPAIVRIAR
jgi:hypothetical protein